MEQHAEKASKAVASADRKLQHALNQHEPHYAGLEPLLENLRVSCGNLALMHHLLDRAAQPIEAKLWDAHVKVKAKYAAWLRTFREGQGKKKHVERRKAEKIFVEFCKASQRFYKAYIGRLTANFTDIPKVWAIAERLEQTGLAAQERKQATEEKRRVLEESCKQCIIRLGDLSRWRESEAQLDKKNWGPAKAYYDLALTLDPAEGACYNGLAAVAFAKEDHLEAVYYCYRAATVGNPHPHASGNIAKEFERVRAVRTEESYGMMESSGEDLVETLEKRFLGFHAQCYARPYDFVAFQQRATDIFGMVALCFQETPHGTFDLFLERACLINMAAEALANKGMNKSLTPATPSLDKATREVERSCQSYFLLQRFNLMTFQSLLRVLARELGDPPAEGQDIADLSRLSVVVRRVLPHLRQYSSWLLSSMRDLVETKYKSSRKLLEQVSKTYAQTLNLLRANVDVFAASPITYLLEEDEKTLSFSPFSGKVYEWRYTNPNTKAVKPARANTGPGKPLAEELAETHLRATDLVVDALKLVMKKDELGLEVVPLALENGQFIGREIPEKELPPAPPSPPKQIWRRTYQSTVSTSDVPDSPSRPASQHLIAAPASPIAADTYKASPKRNRRNGVRKSQNLESPAVPIQTTPEEAASSALNSSSIAVGTPAAPTNTGLTAMDLVRQMQKPSTGSSAIPRSPDSGKRANQAGLPSVFNTPFAPTAIEQAQLSPRLDSAQRRSPSFTVPEINSSAVFAEQLAKQQREIQMRPSPQGGFQPTQSWMSFGQTPTGMDTLFPAFENRPNRTPSPFASSHLQVSGRGESTKTPPQASPFGVIGQARPISQSTPPNGQG